MTTQGLDELAEIIGKTANPGDIVIFLGAGNISEWAYAFPDLLVQNAV